MNALINVFNKRKKVVLANEGRLLKKSFFGLLILTLAFQSGEFGSLIRSSMTDAYLQVSVFVGITLFIFIGLDSLTNFNTAKFLSKTEKFHVPISAFLGALPGCGGAIIVVTQYIQGRIGFGSLVSVLTGRKVKAAVAMTGEITLRGEITPIGGLKEKLLAAMRGGIKTVIIPEDNERELSEVPEKIKSKLEIIKVKWIDQVLEIALETD